MKYNTEDKNVTVYINGKETTLNALQFLQFALNVKTGKQKPLKDIDN